MDVHEAECHVINSIQEAGRSMISKWNAGLNKEDPECAVAKAYQYLNNRSENLNYPKALQAGLPIGSGEVESGHRSVLQARLKKQEHGGT